MYQRFKEDLQQLRYVKDERVEHFFQLWNGSVIALFKDPQVSSSFLAIDARGDVFANDEVIGKHQIAKQRGIFILQQSSRAARNCLKEKPTLLLSLLQM